MDNVNTNNCRKTVYIASPNRYADSENLYRRCGNSGILLPKVSLGMWQNFGASDNFDVCRDIMHFAFNNGIVHFDLANNYGTPVGSAEETFGRVLKNDLMPYRDELFVATKAGYEVWGGPYGNWGSRKTLMANIDQSLKRMNLNYVDLFYSHRFDPNTPIDETLQALVDIVKSGKALYIGLSKWPLEHIKYAYSFLSNQNVKLLAIQDKLNILDRKPQNDGTLSFCREKGIGFIGFSPLAQGLLTPKYLKGIPQNSRMNKGATLKQNVLTPELVAYLNHLNGIAIDRKQQLAEMALSWILDQKGVSSVLLGASSVEQLKQNLACINYAPFNIEL